MTTWTNLGTYLLRTVKVADVSTKQRFEVNELEKSVVLVALGGSIPADAVLALLRTLISASPLAVMLFGVNARIAFDALISELGDGVNQRHIMTGLSEENEIEAAVESLLQATWPSQERFDDWNEYAILSVDGDPRKISQVVKKLCS
jgi:hypothetical protein